MYNKTKKMGKEENQSDQRPPVSWLQDQNNRLKLREIGLEKIVADLIENEEMGQEEAEKLAHEMLDSN